MGSVPKKAAAENEDIDIVPSGQALSIVRPF